MRFIYTIALYLLVPGVFVRLGWRSLRAPEYRRRWGERLSFYSGARLPQLDGAIWVHAVSVGEVEAASPLVTALKAKYPHTPLVVTTMTPTGSRRVRDIFGDEVFHVYVPYDLPGAVNRFLDRVRPRVAVIMETELWPNLFRGCARRGVPVVVANARLSERSARGYRRVRGLIRDVLRDVTVIAAQSRADATRFRALGAHSESVQVTGSIKFEISLRASLREQAEVLRGQLGRDRPVWIAASTHEGEDEQILDALDRIRHSNPNTLLVLVPRHPERFARVASLCRRHGLETVQRSAGESPTPSTDVYLGDTLGELTLMYAASDVAFVGGSLVAVGGHNMLEPAALGLPVVTGPHTFNFEEITEMLLAVDGARQIHNTEELASVTDTLLRDANLRHTLGENARRFVENNKGARDQLLEIVANAMAGTSRVSK